jgi:hypothetical protein
MPCKFSAGFTSRTNLGPFGIGLDGFLEIKSPAVPPYGFAIGLVLEI